VGSINHPLPFPVLSQSAGLRRAGTVRVSSCGSECTCDSENLVRFGPTHLCFGPRMGKVHLTTWVGRQGRNCADTISDRKKGHSGGRLKNRMRSPYSDFLRRLLLGRCWTRIDARHASSCVWRAFPFCVVEWYPSSCMPSLPRPSEPDHGGFSDLWQADPQNRPDKVPVKNYRYITIGFRGRSSVIINH
jgi:hypothetical protein